MPKGPANIETQFRRELTKRTPITKSLLMRAFTLERYQEIILVTLAEDQRALKTLANDPTLPAIQSGLARAMLNAMKSGNVEVIERLVSRIVGKVPDQVSLNATTKNLTLNAEVDEDRLRRLMAKAEEDV